MDFTGQNGRSDRQHGQRQPLLGSCRNDILFKELAEKAGIRWGTHCSMGHLGRGRQFKELLQRLWQVVELQAPRNPNSVTKTTRFLSIYTELRAIKRKPWP